MRPSADRQPTIARDALAPGDRAARDEVARGDIGVEPGNALASGTTGDDGVAQGRGASGRDGGAGAGGREGASDRAGGARGGPGGAGGADLRAWCRSCPRPEYPARARREGWQGTVDVELHVDRDGVVEQASIGRSSGFAVLDAAAVTVARQSRFAVTRGEGLRGQLRYRFVLEEGLSDRPL